MKLTIIERIQNGLRLRLSLELTPATVDTDGELLDEDGADEPSSVRAIPSAKCGGNVVPMPLRKVGGIR